MAAERRRVGRSRRGWIVYLNALNEADDFFDYELRQTALLLGDQPVEYQLAPIPAERCRLRLRRAGLDARRQPALPVAPTNCCPPITTLGFATVDTREGRWRVFGVQPRRA